MPDLIGKALEFEQPALAITDHGNLHGAWEFQERAKKAGIKPIIGMEAYVAPGDRRARDRVGGDRGKPYYHLVLLAQNSIGYKNLVKLSSLAYTEGFYAKPRVDRELLAKYNEGIVVSSACMAGEIAHHLLSDEYDQARAAASWYADVFRDRYYLEVQAHDSENQATLNGRVFQLAAELSLPVLATNDAHFLTRNDHDAHDVLLCIGLGKDFSDTNRMHYDEGLYFKNADEIANAFPGRKDVLENTLRIAEESSIEFSKQYKVPSFPLPSGVETENELLVRLSEEGARVRYGAALPANVRERLDYELGVITSTGYAGYFLIVEDFIRAAREKGIPVGPGRGSAAGSLVAYSLRITDVDPLEFDLLFERFLNPERVSMPDIDVDFCFERRGEVIEYVRQKYGRDSVGQIITFGTLKSRAAIKDVGRTLGFTPSETDYLAKLIPNHPNFSLTVKEAIERIPEVREFYTTRKDDPREVKEKKERYRQLLDYAMKLEGLSRHAGVHAAGVVIAPGPLDEYVPVCTQASKGAGNFTDESTVVTQYDMNALEKAGMLKMDFLGLTTLTVIDDTIHGIRGRTGTAPNLDKLPLNDPETYRVLRAGRTVGVFQFESPLATDMLKSIRADSFDDLVASNALMRQGPLDAGMHKVYMRRKRGEEPVSYILPELKPILEMTYGVITYQEQVMRIAQTLAGISLAEADVLRKAVGKKDAELIRAELGKFIEKSVGLGHDRTIIEEIASQIETFGRYGFNKSHAVAYSIISYHTAWLKAHFPADFMAALLSSQIGDTDNVVKYINEARQLHVPGAKVSGIEILPPDVNESGYKFTVVGETKIRFGLGGIRNVGRTAIDSIIAARQKDGPFKSVFDLCERIDLRVCNKRVLEALVHAGAMDSLGGHRAQLAIALDVAIREASLRQEDLITGQASLFGATSGEDQKSETSRTLPNVPSWTESERLAKEKEILGFYISGHPLERFRTEAEIFSTHTVSDLGAWRVEPMTLAVVVTNIKRQMSKKSGSEFARLTIEDFSGSAEVLIFPEKWTTLNDQIRADVPMLLKGAYSRRDEGGDNPAFIVDSATKLAEMRTNGQVTVAIDLAKGAYSGDVMADVRAIAETFPGSAPLEFRWSDGSGVQARLRSRSLTLAADGATLSALRDILGESSVRLQRGS
ncbi:MAG: DNA polymerase III subunit alpha [Gemmatimonadaceae bacterium]